MVQVYCAEPAWAQEELRLEQPPPTSVEESLIPMDVTFRVPPPAIRPPTALRKRWRKQLEKLPPFLRDTDLNINPRTFYFYRDNFDHTVNATWALGGALVYKSGYLLDRVRIGAVGYTSNRLYGPLARDGTLLLKPGQKNIKVLGQLYGEIKIIDNFVINLFRKGYDTPYINLQDSRMIPNAFEAYAVKARIGDLKQGSSQFRFGGGYFTRMKARDSSNFIPMSRAAGVRQNRGVGVAAGVFEAKNFSCGAINYYSQDLINILYTGGKVNLRLKSGLEFQLAGQFTDQESTGDNLLLNRPFSTRQFGLKGAGSYKGALMTLAYTKNAIGGADLQHSWGSYPGYTSVMVESYNRAGEQALMIQGT